jgi:phosphoribosylaminoimidazolecarboxamide formyltransferase/IMP cyclohydrolase
MGSKGIVLISVTDKTGIEKFGRLAEDGWQIISTGGTAKALLAANIPVTQMEKVTGFPEMLDGRVKTLHPIIFGGILAVHDNKEHQRAISEHGILPIKIAVVNLYNFANKPGIEEIDIGGPSILRAAAKNGRSVIPVIDPVDYNGVINSVIKTGDVSETEHERLAIKVFAHTAEYDRMIVEWMREKHEAKRPFLTPGTSSH